MPRFVRPSSKQVDVDRDEQVGLVLVGRPRAVLEQHALVAVASEQGLVAGGTQTGGQAAGDVERDLLLGEPGGGLGPLVAAAVPGVDDDALHLDREDHPGQPGGLRRRRRAGSRTGSIRLRPDRRHDRTRRRFGERPPAEAGQRDQRAGDDHHQRGEEEHPWEGLLPVEPARRPVLDGADVVLDRTREQPPLQPCVPTADPRQHEAENATSRRRHPSSEPCRGPDRLAGLPWRPPRKDQRRE